MNNVSELKKKRLPVPPQAGDLSVLFKGLQKQMTQVQQLVKEQVVTTRKQVQASESQIQWLERIHDRLDAAAVESRVTNMLLSELVALHQTVITEDTDEAREAVRNEAYRRVRNAE
jgi:hypothetical protein